MASNLSHWASLCADTHCNIKLVEIKFCLTMNVFHLVFVSIAKKKKKAVISLTNLLTLLVFPYTFPIIASIWHLKFDVQFATVLDVFETLSIQHLKMNLYWMWWFILTTEIKTELRNESVNYSKVNPTSAHFTQERNMTKLMTSAVSELTTLLNQSENEFLNIILSCLLLLEQSKWSSYGRWLEYFSTQSGSIFCSWSTRCSYYLVSPTRSDFFHCSFITIRCFLIVVSVLKWDLIT